MSEPKKEWYSHPAVGRYDKRHGNGQLERERSQERELKAIRCRINKLIAELEAAPDVPSKRLYFEILDQERNRLEGKPHTSAGPSKPSSPSNSKLMDDIQNLYMGGLLKTDKEPAERSTEPPEASSEPEPSNVEPEP